MNITPIETPPIIPPDPWDALPKRIQAKVLDDHRLDDVIDSEWWDSLFEDFAFAAETLCIGIADENRGKAIDFQSYPWGASFNGMYGPIVYRAPAQEQFSLARLLIRAGYPQDKDLHRIADELYEVQARNNWTIVAQVKSIGQSTHSMNTSIDVHLDESSDEDSELSDSDEDEVITLLRDFMDWMSERLEAEYDYLTSDEYVIERVREGVIDLSEYKEEDEDG